MGFGVEAFWGFVGGFFFFVCVWVAGSWGGDFLGDFSGVFWWG